MTEAAWGKELNACRPVPCLRSLTGFLTSESAENRLPPPAGRKGQELGPLLYRETEPLESGRQCLPPQRKGEVGGEQLGRFLEAVIDPAPERDGIIDDWPVGFFREGNNVDDPHVIFSYFGTM